MNNKEAIIVLKAIKEHPSMCVYLPEEYEALDLAIKALEERPTGEWIPVSERLPDNKTEVLIQFEYGQSMMVGYHILDLTVYPSEFKDENETGWYDSKDNFICGSDEVIAWMPLPQPYKKEAENE